MDLVGRRFQPEELALNACWAGDITYVRTWEGWMYLATVIDLASRRVVGWAMADHMRADLVCEALEMALSWRRPVARLIFHSDRGSQNNSARFRQLLAAHGIRQSLSRPRQGLGQRGGRSVLLDAEGRARAPLRLGDQGAGAACDLRLHRGLLQPAAPALNAGVPHAGRI